VRRVRYHVKHIIAFRAREYRMAIDSRPPVLFIHQLGLDRSIWAPCIKSLERLDPNRRLIAINLPGHGGTPDQLPYTTDRLVDIINQAVGEAALTPPIIVGSWSSAYLAHAYAAQYPVHGIINFEPFPSPIQIARLLKKAADLAPRVHAEQVWDEVTARFTLNGPLNSSPGNSGQTELRPEVTVIEAYWQELVQTAPETLESRIRTDSLVIESAGTPYKIIMGSPLTAKVRAHIAKELPSASVEIWHGGTGFPYLTFPERLAERVINLE
jgi:pimeloyl-ACP methyl ester carboxylesterase